MAGTVTAALAVLAVIGAPMVVLMRAYKITRRPVGLRNPTPRDAVVTLIAFVVFGIGVCVLAAMAVLS